jgi:energy-coupling factor transporter transmembrane protein EcfT
MKAQQFLNPKSMITPGVAGSMVMLITNTLVIQFGLPGRWISLSLSFLLALVVFLTTTIPMWAARHLLPVQRIIDLLDRGWNEPGWSHHSSSASSRGSWVH